MSTGTNVGLAAAEQLQEPTATPAAWLVQRLRQAIAAAVQRHAISRAETELMALGDRSLKDIGLSRSEIPYAVREALVASELDARLSTQSWG